MIKSQLEDNFEKLVEQGKTQSKKAAKTAAKQIAQTISPTKMWEQILGIDSSPSIPPNPSHPSERSSPELATKGNHTPLNLEKLAKSYQDQESQKTEALKQRLFQLVKRGEEEILEKKKSQEIEKKRREEFEKQEKKRKEEERKKQEQMSEIPKGKVRRSIFSPKKVAERQRAEIKPSTGKQ